MCKNPNEELNGEVTVYPLVRVLDNKVDYFLNMSRIRNAICDFKPDLVHAHYATSWGFLAAVLIPEDIPLILSAWGTDLTEFPYRSFLHRELLRFNLRRADRVLVTSRFLRGELQKVSPESIVEITPFGVDTDFFCPDVQKRSSPQTRLLLAKALLPYYNHHLLLHLLSELKTEGLNVELTLAGEGPLQKELENLANNLQIAEQLRFVGKLESSAVRELLQQTDLVVMPSKVESYGVFALEAQACGIPVVVSNVGGLPEVVVHGHGGFVISLDRPDEMKACIRKLAEDHAFRQQMGKRARDFVERNFSLKCCMQRFHDCYAKYWR